MADAKRRHARNAAGPWFVDTTCIDCDLCREHEPAVFGAADGGTYVIRPPRTDEERRRAWLALQACPVACIGATDEKRPAGAEFPIRIDDGVWLCGMSLRETYGAQAYFVKRPGGNLLIDSPRPAAALHRWMEREGGVAEILLTHADDVAKADEHARKFGARVWIHEADAVPFATDLWKGPGEVAQAPGVRVIPVPGHTEGSVVVLIDDRWLFSGDSLAWDDEASTLYSFRDYCWYSWSEQKKSMARLAKHRFQWVLPGHGRRTPRATEGLPEMLARYAEEM